MVITIIELIEVLLSPQFFFGHVGTSLNNPSLAHFFQGCAESAGTSISLSPRVGSLLALHFTDQLFYHVGENNFLDSMVCISVYGPPQE